MRRVVPWRYGGRRQFAGIYLHGLDGRCRCRCRCRLLWRGETRSDGSRECANRADCGSHHADCGSHHADCGSHHAVCGSHHRAEKPHYAEALQAAWFRRNIVAEGFFHGGRRTKAKGFVVEGTPRHGGRGDARRCVFQEGGLDL